MQGITTALLNNMTYISIIIIIAMIAVFAIGVINNISLKMAYTKILKEMDAINNDGMEVYTNKMLNEIVSAYKEAYLKSYDEVNTQAIIESKFYKLDKGKIGKESFLNNMTTMLVTLGIVGTLYNIIVIITSLTEMFKGVDAATIPSLTSVLGNVSTIIAYLAIAFVTSFIAILLSFIYSVINSFTHVDMERTNLFARLEDYLDNVLGANLAKQRPKQMMGHNEIGNNSNIIYMLENTSNTMMASTSKLEETISMLNDNIKMMITNQGGQIEEVPSSEKTNGVNNVNNNNNYSNIISNNSMQNINSDNLKNEKENVSLNNDNYILVSGLSNDNASTLNPNEVSENLEKLYSDEEEVISEEKLAEENRIKELEIEKNQKLERLKLLEESRRILEMKANEKLESMKNSDVIPNKDKVYIDEATKEIPKAEEFIHKEEIDFSSNNLNLNNTLNNNVNNTLNNDANNSVNVEEEKQEVQEMQPVNQVQPSAEEQVQTTEPIMQNASQPAPQTPADEVPTLNVQVNESISNEIAEVKEEVQQEVNEEIKEEIKEVNDINNTQTYAAENVVQPEVVNQSAAPVQQGQSVEVMKDADAVPTNAVVPEMQMAPVDQAAANVTSNVLPQASNEQAVELPKPEAPNTSQLHVEAPLTPTQEEQIKTAIENEQNKDNKEVQTAEAVSEPKKDIVKELQEQQAIRQLTEEDINNLKLELIRRQEEERRIQEIMLKNKN